MGINDTKGIQSLSGVYKFSLFVIWPFISLIIHPSVCPFVNM